MASSSTSQQLVGPFSRKSLPDYQAAIQHYRTQLSWALSPNMRHIVERIIDSTVRFKDRYSYISYRNFMDGMLPNPDKGFAGIAPIPHMSEKTFYGAVGALCDMGIVIKDGLKYSLDYSIMALDLAEREDVQRRVLHENKRGGLLSTIDGIISWATKLVAHWSGPEQEEKPEPQQNKDEGSTYPIPSIITPTNLPDKSGSIMRAVIKGIIMGTNSASDLKSSILATVQAGRDKQSTKRRNRRTLADECTLFEQAWQRGQRARNSDMPATRIAGADRALLKTQIVKPAQGTKLDVEEFGAWVAEHWDAIGAQYFAKAKSYPEAPALRWLIKCLETYITAFQQREYLDETGSLNKTDLMQKAAGFDRANETAHDTAKAAQERINALEAELRTANNRLAKARRTGRVESDDFEKEMDGITASVGKVKPAAFNEDDWIDPPATSKKKKRIKRKRRA